MRKICSEEIGYILDRHKWWIKGQTVGLFEEEQGFAEQAVMVGCDLRNMDFSDSVLSFADLRDSDLSGANLRNADLRGADLRGANLSGADLKWANVSGANFENTELSGTNFFRTNVRGAKINGLIMFKAIQKGAIGP